jgi:hypothetical protein
LHYAVNQESAKSCCCESSGFEIPEENSSDSELTFPDSAIQVEQSEEFECTGWTGGVNYVPSDTDTNTDDDWKDTDLDGHSEDSGNESLESDSDLEGEDLLDDLENLAKPTPYEHISIS